MSKKPFGPEHPLWGELLELRRSGIFVRDCLKVAHEKGYTDLTYANISTGFGRLHPGFGLPAGKSSLWLQRKHERASRLIDAQQIMLFVLMEVLEDWQGVKEERAQSHHSEAYRTTLAKREFGLREKAIDYAERFQKLVLEAYRVLGHSGDGEGVAGSPALVITDSETMKDAIGVLMERWTGLMEGRLGGLDINAAAIERFGAENIRPAIPEAEHTPLEDEEDFRSEDGEG